MPLYLTSSSYTPETWARLIGKPEDRRRGRPDIHRIRWAASSTGSESTASAPTTGTTSPRARTTCPWRRSRSRSPAAARSKTGAIVLMSVEETLDALRKADEIRYRPPGE